MAAASAGFAGAAESKSTMSLAGEWSFRLDPDREGIDKGWSNAAWDDYILQ